MDNAAAGDATMFANRLVNGGLTSEDADRLLHDVELIDPRVLPEWAEPLRALLGHLSEYRCDNVREVIHHLIGAVHDGDIPFVHAMAPLVHHAADRLGERCGARLRRCLSDDAVRAHQLDVTMLILHQSVQTLWLEFSLFRQPRQSGFERMLLAGMTTPPTGLYDEFTHRLLHGGWTALFEEYSVLARTIAQVIERWVESTARFLDHWEADRAAIAGRFFDGRDAGIITAYGTGQGDVHAGGGSVTLLTFGDGRRLVYKPRNVELEDAWSRLLLWLDEQGLRPSPMPLDVLVRDDHGWVGFIGQRACDTMEDIRDYHRRMGALVFLVYLLHGNDFHHENVIACGAHPVLVDLESIMQPESSGIDDAFDHPAFVQARQAHAGSVLRSGLLPGWNLAGNGHTYDVSGTSDTSGVETAFIMPEWRAINTDAMHATSRTASYGAMPNVPVLDGVRMDAADFVGEIIDGFTRCHTLVAKHAHELPLELFRTTSVRHILRSTRIYAQLLRSAHHPQRMRHGIDRSLAFEALTRAWLRGPAPSRAWALCASELRQIGDLDIPVFQAPADGTAIRAQGVTLVADGLRCPVYEDVLHRLHHLDSRDREMQIRLIRASFALRDMEHGREAMATTPDGGDVPEPATDAQLIDAAEEIARSIAADAIRSADGGCSWITSALLPGTRRFRLMPMSPDLHDGLSGVALFLAALTAVRPTPEVSDLLHGVLHSIESGLRVRMRMSGPPALETIGITSGLPSVVHALVSIASMTGATEPLALALSTAALVDEATIRRDTHWDIIAGAAGCILSMLALHRATGDPGALARAVACGDHLLAHAVDAPGGGLGWPDASGVLLGGYSHGTAGIAHALLRLSEAAGDDRWVDAAQRALRHDRSLFNGRLENWLDLRRFPGVDSDTPRAMTAWCHGASGIGMGRIALPRRFRDEATEDDIARALAATLRHPVAGSDHLCCGTMGRIELLLLAARDRGDAALEVEARRRAAIVLRRAAQHDGYTLNLGTAGGLAAPGLFQGLSGVGHQCLRIAAPEAVPSILIFE